MRTFFLLLAFLVPLLRHPLSHVIGIYLLTAGALGLTLAAIGIFSVLSYSVAQRTHEIGVRIALGASPADIRSLVVGQGVRLAAVGIGVGIVGALATSWALNALLFGLSATDPPTFAMAAVALTFAAFAAVYVPARRASRIDPVVMLR